jgi:hypothetical protein
MKLALALVKLELVKLPTPAGPALELGSCVEALLLRSN